ncbi:MAG: hypothetical protein IK113_05250 [Bacteroidales bacterium]|nr:hypothetical protein [Bacteroidales bacterium]
MRKLIISAFMLLILGAGLRAQNLDPTVVVTNTYAQQAGVVEKPSQLMEMPDSVLRFNLDFDYSALSVPYRGAYEFKPYLVELRPTKRPSGESLLYLSGGAGYTVHPELDVIWNPVQKDFFKLNVYGSHRSYFGQYRNIGLQGDWLLWDGSRRDGFNMRTVAGINALYTWTGGRLEGDIRYRNIFASRQADQKDAYNAVDFGLRLESDPDASLYYIVRNRSTVMQAPQGKEAHVKTEAGIGTRFGEHYLRLGILADIISTDASGGGNLAITPRYIFENGDFTFDLGAKVSFIFRSDPAFYPMAFHPWNFPLFPDVHISYCLIPDSIALYASVTGSHILNTYESLADENPFLAAFAGQMDASAEPLNAAIGFRGNISERFHYDLSAGYAFRANALLWGFTDAQLPAFGYVDKYHMLYAKLESGWKGDRIDAHANITFRKTWLKEDRLFAPAMFEGNAKVVYNWGRRIHAGVTFDGQTERTAFLGSLPGYADLGLLGDIQMTTKLGLWLKVGNLLDQTVQRVPFYAEKGIYFTVGARLIL